MVETILAELSKTSFDFGKFANPSDSLSALFEEWVPYYRLEFCIAKVRRPNSILEVGVRYGYSARTFLEANPSAKFVGVDLDCDSFRCYYEKRYVRLRTDAQQLAHFSQRSQSWSPVFFTILSEPFVTSSSSRPQRRRRPMH